MQFGQSLDYPTVDVNVDRETRRADGREDGRRVALARRGHVVEPLRRAELLGRSEQRRRLPDPGADPAGADEFARAGARTSRSLNRGGQTRAAAQRRQRHAKARAVGQYERYNMQRMVTVTANIASADLGSVATQRVARRSTSSASRRRE